MATIIFDFDDTLFDTQRLKEQIFEILEKSGVPNDIIHRSYKQSQSILGSYSIDNHLKILKDKYDISEEMNINDWLNDADLTSHVLPEIDELLQNLSNNHYLILLTKGDFDFQTLKINKSDLKKHFREIHIIKEDKDLFLKDKSFSGSVYFVNDKDKENEIIKNNFPDFNIIKKEYGEPLRLPVFE